MNTANLTFRFLGFGRVQRAAPVDDPADMGTCFGLDMSIDDPRRLSARRRSQD